MKKMTEQFLDCAYKEAQRVLKNCAHPMGFKASARLDGYPQIWARDSMITALGALLGKPQDLIKTVEASLETLAKYQTPLGMIPNNVHSVTKNAYSFNNGAADAPSWYVIGLEAFSRTAKPSRAFLQRHFLHAESALHWLAYQDQNGDGLIEMQEAGEWEDLFAVRGAGLYINVLWYLALLRGALLAKRLGKRAQAVKWQKQARDVRKLINERLWLSRPPKCLRGEWDNAYRVIWKKLGDRPFYLPYYSFWQFGEWCDALANLLAILSGVASKAQTGKILNHFKRIGISSPYPTKALLPVVTPKNPEWREYYRRHNLNLPNQYHNGGIWPFIGGFYILALIKTKKFKEAEENLVKLAKANQKGKEMEWEFNEWLHGKTGKPMGMVKQAWSAGMFIYAYEALKQKSLIHF